MVRIYLVRHGQASFSAADYDQLSDTGAEQARHLGDWFDHCAFPVHHAVAGGMKRHYQTAENFFSTYPRVTGWQQRLGRDAGLNEFDHKDILDAYFRAEDPEAVARGVKFGHMSPAEFNIKMHAALSRWAAGKHDDDYQEPWPEFNRRCVAALDAAAALGDTGENVVAFTSCGTISAMCRHILGISIDEMVNLMWEITNGSVTCITRKRSGRYALSGFNTTAHLDRLGRPELITLK